MNGLLRTTTLTLLVAIGISLAGITAYAADDKPPKDKIVTPSMVPAASKIVGPTDFKAVLHANDQKLASIESLLARVESSKVISEKDSEDLGKTMYEYAEAMKNAFDKATKEAEKASKSQGKEGDVQLLNQFENTAKVHERRMQQIEGRTQKLDGLLKVGAIRLDRPLLQKMTPQERGEFRQHLQPKGIQEMEKLHPDLFKGMQNIPMQKPGVSTAPDDGTQVSSLDSICCMAAVSKVGDLLVSPAEAALAAPCIGKCLAKNWTACAACVASKGPEAIRAWNSFVGCWNGAGKCWKPWTWPKKAWCLAKLIGKLA